MQFYPVLQSVVRMISNFNTVQNNLLKLLSHTLFENDYDFDTASADLTKVWNEAYYQAVPLIAFSDFKLSSGSISPLFHSEMANIFTRNVKMASEHTRIHKIMQANNIPYTIIKGFSSALYYPDAMLRESGDVDFIVKRENFEKADKALKSNGFKQIKDIHECHWVYTYDNCRYEMHFEPSGIPDGSVGEIIRDYLSDTVDCATTVKTEVGELRIPPDFHYGLISLLHIAHHMCGEGIGLRHLCDWAVFVSKFDDSDFIKLFKNALSNIGLWQFSCVITKICVKYLGCPPKSFARADDKLCDSLMADVFSGGNFGQKNQDRSHEQLIFNNVTQKIEFKNLLKKANRVVYNHWKISRKIKILLPIGWLFYGLRYLFRSFTGKRPKIRLNDIYSDAKARKTIFAKLNLFINKKDDING